MRDAARVVRQIGRSPSKERTFAQAMLPYALAVRVDEPTGSRWDLALDLLRRGESPISIGPVTFSRGDAHPSRAPGGLRTSARNAHGLTLTRLAGGPRSYSPPMSDSERPLEQRAKHLWREFAGKAHHSPPLHHHDCHRAVGGTHFKARRRLVRGRQVVCAKHLHSAPLRHVSLRCAS